MSGLDGTVSIRELTVRYPGTADPALAGVTLDISGGELVGVLGLTGAGKSTLLRCVAGIVPNLVPAEVTGSIRVTGLDPLGEAVGTLSGRVAVVLDDPDAQVSQATVADEVALGLESMAVPWSEMVIRVDAALEMVGLASLGERSPASLSGGEQQRLAIACAIAMQPAVLVMDEPTANLDPAGSRALFELVRRLSRDDGWTVLIADHDVERLANHADRIVLLRAGRLVAAGSPGDVLGRPDALETLGMRVPQVTELAARLAGPLGRSAASRLPVTVDETAAWLAPRIPGADPSP